MKRIHPAVCLSFAVVFVLSMFVLVASRKTRLAGQDQRRVKISYTFHRLPRIASNQYAVWIEDTKGKYVKTLYATRFMARGGYVRRPQCCPVWRARANWAEASPERIDAVAGATPPSGNLELVWDCTDEKGKPVPDGVYLYHIEGNLYWENRVVWTGKIEVGPKPDASEAAAQYFPEDAARWGPMIEEVKAVYVPDGE
ncbi:MAG: DUF2271 domain-containing protein [Firmicutes bacterium]|nr:DUF2271 domain-containing protein [Bacillota bacterium]